MLQIGAASFYYKLGQTLLQIGAASLLQIRASVVTNWGKMYYKLEQVLQIRAIITNWGITSVSLWIQKMIHYTVCFVTINRKVEIMPR